MTGGWGGERRGNNGVRTGWREIGVINKQGHTERNAGGWRESFESQCLGRQKINNVISSYSLSFLLATLFFIFLNFWFQLDVNCTIWWACRVLCKMSWFFLIHILNFWIIILLKTFFKKIYKIKLFKNNNDISSITWCTVLSTGASRARGFLVRTRWLIGFLLLCVRFVCSPGACMSSLQVLWLPLRVQRHAR